MPIEIKDELTNTIHSFEDGTSFEVIKKVMANFRAKQKPFSFGGGKPQDIPSGATGEFKTTSIQGLVNKLKQPVEIPKTIQKLKTPVEVAESFLPTGLYTAVKGTTTPILENRSPNLKDYLQAGKEDITGLAIGKTIKAVTPIWKNLFVNRKIDTALAKSFEDLGVKPSWADITKSESYKQLQGFFSSTIAGAGQAKRFTESQYNVLKNHIDNVIKDAGITDKSTIEKFGNSVIEKFEGHPILQSFKNLLVSKKANIRNDINKLYKLGNLNGQGLSFTIGKGNQLVPAINDFIKTLNVPEIPFASKDLNRLQVLAENLKGGNISWDDFDFLKKTINSRIEQTKPTTLGEGNVSYKFLNDLKGLANQVEDSAFSQILNKRPELEKKIEFLKKARKLNVEYSNKYFSKTTKPIYEKIERKTPYIAETIQSIGATPTKAQELAEISKEATDIATGRGGQITDILKTEPNKVFDKLLVPNSKDNIKMFYKTLGNNEPLKQQFKGWVIKEKLFPMTAKGETKTVNGISQVIPYRDVTAKGLLDFKKNFGEEVYNEIFDKPDRMLLEKIATVGNSSQGMEQLLKGVMHAERTGSLGINAMARVALSTLISVSGVPSAFIYLSKTKPTRMKTIELMLEGADSPKGQALVKFLSNEANKAKQYLPITNAVQQTKENKTKPFARAVDMTKKPNTLKKAVELSRENLQYGY